MSKIDEGLQNILLRVLDERVQGAVTDLEASLNSALTNIKNIKNIKSSGASSLFRNFSKHRVDVQKIITQLRLEQVELLKQYIETDSGAAVLALRKYWKAQALQGQTHEQLRYAEARCLNLDLVLNEQRFKTFLEKAFVNLNSRPDASLKSALTCYAASKNPLCTPTMHELYNVKDQLETLHAQAAGIITQFIQARYEGA